MSERDGVRPDPDSLEPLWLPFTPNRLFKENPRLIAGGEGAYYLTADGRRLFDGLSGLWCCGLGHARPEIADAVSRQMRTLDYAPAFQISTPLAVELANRLVAITPAGLDHVFFTNSGSESVDTALKMARAYWHVKGEPGKTKLIGRLKGYHGVNFGGTSVGGIGPNRGPFMPGIEVDHIPHTLLAANAFSRGQPDKGAELADALEDLVTLHGAANIAAVIVEPFAGSAGVIVPPRGYLKRLRDICTRHGILLIFDEVITGFGRTGHAFGADTFEVTPDIMTLAKGITNGTVPMGAVVASDEVHAAFMEQKLPPHVTEFPHGYTYSAHPVACAAAIATLGIYAREDTFATVRDLAPYFEERIHALRGLNHVADIRNIGLAGAIQFAPRDGDAVIRPYEIFVECFTRDALVRCGGDTIQLAPPFISTRDQIDRLFDTLETVIRETA